MDHAHPPVNDTAPRASFADTDRNDGDDGVPGEAFDRPAAGEPARPIPDPGFTRLPVAARPPTPGDLALAPLPSPFTAPTSTGESTEDTGARDEPGRSR